MYNELGNNHFWEHHTLDKLAELQQVKPVYDVGELYGSWPGEVDDGFEFVIEKLRYPDRNTTNE